MPDVPRAGGLVNCLNINRGVVPPRAHRIGWSSADDKDEERPISEDQTAEAHDRIASSAKLEAIFLGYWRRALQAGGGLDLTLPEAAALLGVSVDSLRRRIKAGEIKTRRDARGRILVVPVVGTNADTSTAEALSQESIVRLWEELKAARRDLAEAVSDREAIARELASAREALSWAEDELATRWGPGLQNWPLGQPVDVEAQRQRRVSIESKINEARKLAGRRRVLGANLPGLGVFA